MTEDFSDLSAQAFARWGGVCRALGGKAICSDCPATVDTYGDVCRRPGRRCPGYHSIEKTVADLVAADPRTQRAQPPSET